MSTNALTLTALQARRMPDESVFDRTLAGDPVAFAEVYRRYHKRITGYCLARSLDPDTAADAAQEVFIRLLAAEPGTIEHPRAWLFTVARNAVIDVKRRRARAAEDGEIEEDSIAWDRLKSADTADEVLARADARNVFLALRSMRPRYRTALVMRDIHGQTAKDMAEALEMTPGAVDTLVSRARDAFGAAYAEVGNLPADCRGAIELIYRRGGSGITPEEQASLDAHLEGCSRCRAEAKRAGDPKRLAALLPFLLPAKELAHGLLQRATLALRHFPDAAAAQAAPVLSQPHTWNLATKIAAAAIATTLVAAPVATTMMVRSHRAPIAARADSAAAMRSWSMSGTTASGRAWSMTSGPARAWSMPTAAPGDLMHWTNSSMPADTGMGSGSGMAGTSGSGTRAGMSGPGWSSPSGSMGTSVGSGSGTGSGTSGMPSSGSGMSSGSGTSGSGSMGGWSGTSGAGTTGSGWSGTSGSGTSGSGWSGGAISGGSGSSTPMH